MIQIAIVGRPNVGKSTLFNKLTGHRTSIVDDTPGVTRDRVYGEANWRGRNFTVIDTGGFTDIDETAPGNILSEMREQALIAIELANAVILVTDVRTGITADDEAVAQILRQSGKPVTLAVNKCDNVGNPPADFYEFYNLGLSEPVALSASHGHGTGDLLDDVYEKLGLLHTKPEQDDTEDTEETQDGETKQTLPKVIKVALVGRPNVGKSSLANFIIGQNRSIVSDVAGTTRDAIDTPVKRGEQEYLIIDTAGLRRKSRVSESIEYYGGIRAWAAIDRADVVVMMLDGVQGFAEQDSKIAGYAHEKGKPTVIAINKWDAVEKNDKTMSETQKRLENDFSFMSYAPYCFISARTGQRVDKLFEVINEAVLQNRRRITTGLLNEMLAYATGRVQPPSDKGKRLKLFYITQVAAAPPTFAVFCNSIDLFHFSYERYIENRIREGFGLTYTPLVILKRERGNDKK